MKWIKELISQNKKINLSMVIEKNGKDFPLLLKLEETEQDPEWHSEGNVFIHTNMVIDEMYAIFEEEELSLSDKYILLMSAIFHDIAKPLVSKWKEVRGVERLTARNHEYEGMSYLFYRFLEMEMDEEESKHILNLVGYHQLPKLLVVRDGSDKWDYKLLTNETRGELFYLLELADMRGRTAKDKEDQIEYIELFKMCAEDYDCFHTSSDLDKELESLFIENFDCTDPLELSYLVGKTKKRLRDKEILDPLVAYQKYFEHKSNHATLYLMCGLSGSGKTTTVNSLIENNNVTTVIELDALRKKHDVKRNNRREVDGRVRQEAKELLKRALSNKESVVFDACNQRKDFRTQIADLAEEYFAKTVLVFVKTPVSQCIKNDRDRTIRTIGSDVIESQQRQFQYPEDSEFNEVY